MNEYSVAVVTFLKVNAVDEADAHHLAEGLVKHNLAGAGERHGDHVVLRDEQHGIEFEGKLYRVREIGMAAHNGDLYLQPTSRPYSR